MDKDLIGNERKILANNDCNRVINELIEICDFLDNLSESFFGRTFLLSKHVIDCSKMVNSAEYTLRNVVNCCKKYTLSDAMTLLRKFKDDLWFILYALTYNYKVLELDRNNRIIQKMNDWFDNSLKGLKAEIVIEDVFSLNDLSKLNEKFNIKASLDSMAKKMDDYVHSNGLQFYNELVLGISEKHINNLNLVKEIAICNVMFFLIVCALRFPHCISSSDYVDYLDMGYEPPEGSQYWVAPYITDFIIKHKNLIDENLKDFLIENSCMDFNDK